jgi:hypothetical protein
MVLAVVHKPAVAQETTHHIHLYIVIGKSDDYPNSSIKRTITATVCQLNISERAAAQSAFERRRACCNALSLSLSNWARSTFDQRGVFCCSLRRAFSIVRWNARRRIRRCVIQPFVIAGRVINYR